MPLGIGRARSTDAVAKGDRIILHVDMDAFFAAVEELCDPALAGKPVMVCGSRDTRTVVAAANYEARKYGVSSGMPIGMAKARCPNGVYVEGDPEKYVYASLRMNDVCREFSPVLERYSIDESFLDITETARHFGGPLELGRRLKQRIKARFGLTVSVGIGPNKALAKMGSKLEKPDGQPGQAASTPCRSTNCSGWAAGRRRSWASSA
ncbi:MAG: DNA polymerase IV [Planctomycetota bacterium]